MKLFLKFCVCVFVCVCVCVCVCLCVCARVRVHVRKDIAVISNSFSNSRSNTFFSSDLFTCRLDEHRSLPFLEMLRISSADILFKMAQMMPIQPQQDVSVNDVLHILLWY